MAISPQMVQALMGNHSQPTPQTNPQPIYGGPMVNVASLPNGGRPLPQMLPIALKPQQFIAPPAGYVPQGSPITPYARIGQPTSPGGPTQAPPSQVATLQQSILQKLQATDQSGQVSTDSSGAPLHIKSYAQGIQDGHSLALAKMASLQGSSQQLQ